MRGVRKRPIWEFELEQARRQLCQHFAVRDLIGFGCDDAARCALCRRRPHTYAKETQRTHLSQIQSLRLESLAQTVAMDSATRHNLEIDQNLKGGEEFTLFAQLNTCVTPMGARLMRRWLHQPCAMLTALGLRQDAIAALLANYHYEALRSELKPSAI